MTVEEALDIRAVDGARFPDELESIGYAGGVPSPGPALTPLSNSISSRAPFLKLKTSKLAQLRESKEFHGQRSPCGPVEPCGHDTDGDEKDPAVALFTIGAELQRIVERIGEAQVGTIGRAELVPNLVNVVPASATFTVDVRHTDDETLINVEREVAALIEEVAAQHGLLVETESLARFAPVVFDDRVVEIVERSAQQRELSVKRMPSGAGHSAQMLARVPVGDGLHAKRARDQP